MLVHITGKISSIATSSIGVDVHGIGFELQIAHASQFYKDQLVTLPVYFHWNQEQGPTIFGFTSELEKTVFLLVISCSGIGPKMGLAILSHLAPAVFLKAIQENDEKTVSSVSGIGPKKAEQIIVQLRHKVGKLIESGAVTDTQTDGTLEQWRNVTQVLQSLNYSRSEIDGAIAHMRKESTAGMNFDGLIRQALSFLAKRM